MKKLLSGLLSAALLIGCLAGCGSKSEPAPAPSAPAASAGDATIGETTVSGDVVEVVEDANTKYQETITIGINADTLTNDVMNTSSVVDRSNSVIVFDTLIAMDTETMTVVPGLATEWKQVSDTEWEFKLREGVKFHDGTDFTSEDAVFSIARGVVESQSKNKLNTVDHAEAIDEYTIKIVLTQMDPDIVYKLCDICCVMMSKDAFDSKPVEEACMIGTGPYMYTEYVAGSHFSFTRFDDFWGGAAKTKNIVIKYIPESSARLIALQTGEIDMCLEPPATDMHYVAEDPNLVLYQINGTNLRYVWFNVNVEPFNNPLVRKAVAHAINREDILAMVYNGNATLIYNVMHPDSEYNNPDAPYQEYDLEKAKALLTEAGYPNGFECDVYCTTANIQKSVATVIQAQLAAIGIKVNVNAVESAAFSSGAKKGGSFDFAVDGWGGHVMGPDYALRTVFHTDGTTRSNLNDPHVNELLDEGLSTADVEARKATYFELQDYIMGEVCPWVPIAIERINWATKNTVQGFTLPHGTVQNYRNIYIVEQ